MTWVSAAVLTSGEKSVYPLPRSMYSYSHLAGWVFGTRRHSHKTWMAEDGIPEILAEQRLGHDVPPGCAAYTPMSRLGCGTI